MVKVRAVFQQEEDQSYYTESVRAIDDIDYQSIKTMIEKSVKDIEGYKDCRYVGDIHTHPVLPS